MKILEMLSEHPSGLLMGEMKELQLPTASLYRMLITLTELGYIIRDEHERYHLGRKLLSVGYKAPPAEDRKEAVGLHRLRLRL